MSSPIYQAIKQISDEKNIPVESVISTIEAALAAAFRKDFGTSKSQNIKVNFDAETGNFEVFDVKTVVEDMELPTEEELAAQEAERKAKAAEARVEPQTTDAPPLEEEKKFNPKTEMMITEAKTVKADAQIGEELRIRLEVPAAFGRMAAQTAKQVIIQNIREAERNKVFADFKDREGELVNATVQRRDGRNVLIDLGNATGILASEDQIQTERYAPGDRVKVFIVSVRLGARGPEVMVSRTHPDIIRTLFATEIPEIASGVVEIHGIAREAGARSKVAVSSKQENVDPIGSCIGQRGTRIQTIIGELGGEKIDIIQFDEDATRFITNALSPAKVTSIALREDEHIVDVSVAEDQLSLAIGKGGQNVRLASRLTGWKINVKQIDAIEDANATPAPDEDAPTSLNADNVA